MYGLTKLLDEDSRIKLDKDLIDKIRATTKNQHSIAVHKIPFDTLYLIVSREAINK